MNRAYYIVGVLLAMLFIAGCQHVSQAGFLDEAEAFLPAEPDSADAWLVMVDIRQLRGDEERALYALLRTRTDALLYKTPLNDTLAAQAYAFYGSTSRLGSSSAPALVRRFALSALYMGDCYAAVDSTKACEDCYRQAIRYSEQSEDWHTCYIAYERLAEQVQWSNPEEAIELINKAIEIYGKCNDNVANLLSLYHCAAHYTFQIAYLHEADYQEAIALTQREYELATQHGLQLYENQSRSFLAFIYWTKGDYPLALNYAKQIKFTSLNKDYEQTWNRILAQCYLGCDSLAQAKSVLNQLQNISSKKEAYLYARELAEISIRNEERDSAIHYLDSALSSAEAMFFDALQAKDDYYHDKLAKEQQNERLLYKDKLKTWIFGGAVFLILISSLLIGRVLILRIKVHREQQERKEEEARHLQQEMRLLQGQQQALEDSHQKKAAAIKYLQRYIIDRTHITTKLKSAATRVDMSSKEWNDVEMLLNDIDDGRISKIRARYQDLSIDDIRLCVMVRIGMSNPAIGKVFCISPSAVQHRKLTLKKKGFGVTDPDITLNDFIGTL